MHLKSCPQADQQVPDKCFYFQHSKAFILVLQERDSRKKKEVLNVDSSKMQSLLLLGDTAKDEHPCTQSCTGEF